MSSWEKNFRNVTPYIPGEQPDRETMIKLNTNENPYPPAPGVKTELKNFSTDQFRLYPDMNSTLLVNELAKFYKVDPEQIFTGVGSDDVLAIAFMSFFNSGKPILFPDITYSFYKVWAELFKIPYETPILNEQFHIIKEDYYRENGGVIIANPNAPTSICENLDFIEDILKHNKNVIVIVDEAYIDFGGESACGLLKKYDNLLIVQTFSKARSMAGARIGYAMGDQRLIQEMHRVKHSFNSYTLNSLTIRCGAASLKDTDYFYTTLDKIVFTRERMKKELFQMGFKFPDSKTNFLFITHSEFPAQQLFDMLRKNDIYVRYFDKPRIKNYLRMTIGTDRQMDHVIECIKQHLK